MYICDVSEVPPPVIDIHIAIILGWTYHKLVFADAWEQDTFAFAAISSSSLIIQTFHSKRILPREQNDGNFVAKKVSAADAAAKLPIVLYLKASLLPMIGGIAVAVTGMVNPCFG